MERMTPEEIVAEAEARYEYETTHPDMADGYIYCFPEPPEPHYREEYIYRFDYYPMADGFDYEADSVYLGQSEIEVQFEQILNDADCEALGDAGWYAKPGTDLAYCPYPLHLMVVRELPEEED